MFRIEVHRPRSLISYVGYWQNQLEGFEYELNIFIDRNVHLTECICVNSNEFAPSSKQLNCHSKIRSSFGFKLPLSIIVYRYFVWHIMWIACVMHWNDSACAWVSKIFCLVPLIFEGRQHISICSTFFPLSFPFIGKTYFIDTFHTLTIESGRWKRNGIIYCRWMWNVYQFNQNRLNFHVLYSVFFVNFIIFSFIVWGWLRACPAEKLLLELFLAILCFSVMKRMDWTKHPL